MTGPRSELLAERAKLSTWAEPLTGVPQFGARYCIWLVDLARGALADQDVTIAQLRAELDDAAHRNVLHVTERYAPQAQAASLREEDGTLMRATDTGREWVFTRGGWHDHEEKDHDEVSQ